VMDSRGRNAATAGETFFIAFSSERYEPYEIHKEAINIYKGGIKKKGPQHIWLRPGWRALHSQKLSFNAA